MKIAVIRCVGDSEKLKYRNMKERYRHNRYHSILNDLRFHGAERLDAAQAAAWAMTAEAGEKKTIEPGIEISIEEAERPERPKEGE